jgi:hypothetical protein
VDDGGLETVMLEVRGARGLEAAFGQGRRRSRAGAGHGRRSDARVADGDGSSDGEEEISPRVPGLALKHLIRVDL